MVVAACKLIPEMNNVFFRTRKMTKKWQWNITDEILDTNVGDLRKEFNIIID